MKRNTVTCHRTGLEIDAHEPGWHQMKNALRVSRKPVA